MDTFLEYCEPVMGMDSDGNEIVVNITIRISMKDAISLTRYNMKKRGIELSDDLLLDHFIVNNNACVIK